ncbi:MAG: hypothetical protein BWK80_51730 [Desulfobacteraceae bacterium IS3]|nr:MAG: hypothetical protein BWK80_51730 [Desulfobacteraceae bacterium IS3]
MKVRMNGQFLLLALSVLCCIFTSSVFADQITIDLPSVNISVSKDADGFAKFSFTNPEHATIQFIGKTGEPAIPYLIVKTLLPPAADLSTVKVTIQNSAYSSNSVESYGGWDVRPVPEYIVNQSEPVLNASGEDETIYSTNALFPETLVSNVSTGNVWEWQLADIPIALFQYNPVNKELFKINSNEAVVIFEHRQSTRSTSDIQITSSSYVEDRVRRLALNFDQISSEYSRPNTSRDVSQAKTSYVIITTRAIISASAQLDNFFIKHKQTRNFNVHVITEDIWGGGTGNIGAENIRSWLKNNYKSLNIEYVLLIGNPNPATGDVPMKMFWPRNNTTRETSYKDSPSDYYYADLTGNWDLDGDGKFGEWGDDFGAGGVDRNFEVIVGRIPYYGNSAELDSILAKIMSYQNESSQDWRKNILLPMKPSDNSTPGYHLGEAIKNDVIIPKGWGYYRIYEQNYGLSPAPEKFPCTVDNVTNAWKNTPFGGVFWWTHGNETIASNIMDNSHAATLDNTHPSFTFQCSCTNSHPETNNNLSYSLLKNGAIATLGATRVSWYWVGQTDFPGTPSNSGLTYEYARQLLNNDVKGCGYALYEMKQSLNPSAEYGWMNFTDFCLYGDPEVSLMNTDNTPILSVSPASRTIPKSSGTTTFLIANSGKGSMNWTATSNVTWLKLRNNTGTDNGTLIVDYDPVETDRTGTITISATGAKNSPQTVEVKQSDVEWQLYEDFEEKVINENKWVRYNNPKTQCNNVPCYQYLFDNGRLKLLTSNTHSEVWPYPNSDTFDYVGINTAIKMKNAQLPIGLKADFTMDTTNSIDGVNTQSLIEIRFTGDSGANYVGTIGFQHHTNPDSYHIYFHCFKDPEYTPIGQDKPIEKEVFLGKTISFFIELANQGSAGLIANASYTVDNQEYHFNSFDFISNFKDSGETFEKVIGDKSITVNISNGMSLIKPDTLKVPMTDEAFVKGVRSLFVGKELITYVDNIYLKNTSILTVNPDFQTVPATSGTTNFTVKNIGAGMMNWSAVSNASWLTISPSTETNGEVLTVNYQANSGNERTGAIVISAGNAEGSLKTIEVRQAGKSQPHFTKVWTGNPYNRMSLWVVGASVNGTPLSAGDEIAVFDGDKCVGAGIVEKFITATTKLEIRSSQDDGSGNGFVEGNSISFRFWDASEGKELTGVTPSFKEPTYGKPISPPVFKGKEDYGVVLEIGGSQQTIALNNGWNMMSSYVVPENTDMIQMLQPLINSGCLDKVISQSGGSVQMLFGEWTNTIGNYNSQEGYKIKLKCDAQFPIKGFSIQSQSNMYTASQSISLITGWNIISYPFSLSQNALTAIQPLIDSENLIKVIDENGGTIIKLFGNWINTIGDLKPGEGYEIKVGSDMPLLINPPNSSVRSADSTILKGITGVHFIPLWSDCPYNPMNLWLTSYPAENDDEIGIFDGDKCVGVGVVTGQQNWLQIITSQDENNGKGFTEGHTIVIKFWDASKQTETVITPIFTDMNGRTPLQSPIFKPKGDYAVIFELELQHAVAGLKILTGMAANTFADADKNGKVELKDVIYMLQWIAGLRG